MQEAIFLLACLLQVSCFAHSQTLKLEGVRSYETSVNFYGITWSRTAAESALRCFVFMAKITKLLNWILGTLSGGHEELCLQGHKVV
jgi:hypothetical protein